MIVKIFYFKEFSYLCKMKKLLLISFIAFGCKTIKPNIQHSPVAVVSYDTTHIWILNESQGPIIYNVWKKGVYGNKTQPHLVDSIEFANLCKRAVHCTCGDVSPKYTTKNNVIYTSGK